MKKLWIIVFSTFAVLAVIVGIFAPDAKFNYLLGTVSYLPVFIIIALVALIGFLTSGNEERESKIYITPEGEFDTTTPREYHPLRINAFSKIFGRANKFHQRNLHEFRYSDGKIFVENSKGESIEAPLSEITFSYKKDKRKGVVNDTWYVYQYQIFDKNGNKVQFNYHSFLFNDEEYDDILMLLSLAPKVKESSISKFTQIADKMVSTVGEGVPDNVIDALDSSGEIIKDSREVTMNKIGIETKERLLEKRQAEDESNEKESTFEKIVKYGLIGILGIYVLLVIWVNVEPLFYSGDTEGEQIEMYAENAENVGNKNEVIITEESIDTTVIANPDKITYHKYSGAIDGKYEVVMTLRSDGQGEYYYVKSGSDAVLDLIITKLEDDGRITIEEYNNEGEQTGLFKGRIVDNEFMGWFTNYKGHEMPFSLEEIDGD